MQAAFLDGSLDVANLQKKSEELKIEERMRRNAEQIERAHLFSEEELRCGIAQASIGALTALLSIRHGEVPAGFTFPTKIIPSNSRRSWLCPPGPAGFLTPRVRIELSGRRLSESFCRGDSIRDRYLKSRDKSTERWVTERIRKLFPGSDVYPNYYIEKGSHEKDIFVRFGDTIILFECKNSRIRHFKGAGDDLLKFEEDFSKLCSV